jgi:hypothetical protein
MGGTNREKIVPLIHQAPRKVKQNLFPTMNFGIISDLQDPQLDKPLNKGNSKNENFR